MTNGGGQGQALRANMPPAFEMAQRLHAEFTDAMTNYRDWIEGQEQKIMLWNTIRSVLLEAENGEASMATQDVLEALGSERTNIDDLTWAEAELLETNVGKVRGGGDGDDPSDKILEAEQLLGHFEETDLDDTVPFFYFGWQLVLRKIVVEYHAQRLRIYLYTGELDEDAYPKMPTWREFRRYATEADEGDGNLRIRGLFGDYLGALNNHGGLMAGVAGDSAFFEELAEKSYFAQMDVVFQLTYGLSSSFVGQRILADLAWGYYGYRRDGDPDQRFALVDFFKKPSDPTTSVVNWDARSAVDDYLGLNQQSFFALYFAIQVVPGYHRAVAMARDGSDISTAELERIEREAATVLGTFTEDPQTAMGDFALPMMAEQNGHDTGQVRQFLELLTGGLDSKFAAVPAVIITDWARATGIKQELGFGPSETVTVAKVENVPDAQLSRAFEDGVEAADANDPSYPKWSAEGSIALRRFLHAYNLLGNLYGSVLFFSADARDDSYQQDLEDFKMFLSMGANLYTLTRSLQGDEIEWEDIDLEGSTETSWRPTRYSQDPEELRTRLSEMDSRVKSALVSDLEETIEHLNKLEATANVIEYNAFDHPTTSNQFTLDPRHVDQIERDIGEARGRIHHAKANARLFRTRLQNMNLEQAASLIAGGRLNSILRSSQNALVGLDSVVSTLEDNAGGWSASKVETEVFDHTGMVSGMSVEGEQYYQGAAQLDPSSSPLQSASLQTREALTDFVQLDLGGEEMGNLLSEGGLDSRLQRAEAVQGWFTSHGSEADLQYTMRTADMLDEGMTATRPPMGRFLFRVVMELVGTVADVLDLVINTMNTISSWEKGDHSAAGGFALQVAGTGVMLLASGPVVWIGAAIVVAGIALVAFTTDSDVTVWIRHTFFGRLWFQPATKEWDEEFDRWGSFLGTLLYEAARELEDTDSGTDSTGSDDGGRSDGQGSDADSADSDSAEAFQYPTAWSRFATYTQISRDPDMMKYFASQLAWFYKHAKPFEVPTATLGTDGDGYPTLTIKVEDPATSGENSETFDFNSMVLAQPVVFTSPVGDDRYRAWRMGAMDFQISDDTRTYQWADFTWDEPNIKGYTDPDVEVNEDAASNVFDLQPSQGYLQYDATIRQYAIATQQGTTNPQTRGVWIDSVTYEVGFTREFKDDFETAYAADDQEPVHPLNWLFNLHAPNLESRLDAPAELDGDARSRFDIGGEVLMKRLGVEVYHLPAELVKATREYSDAKGQSWTDALRQVTLNPFAARVGTFVTVPDDYALNPPEWINNV